jgi:hypothetical protein
MKGENSKVIALLKLAYFTICNFIAISSHLMGRNFMGMSRPNDLQFVHL